MRISSGGMGGIGDSSSSSFLGRRRGTPRRKRGGSDNMVLNQKSILVLLALCATIFSAGLIVGTRIFGSPGSPDSADGGSGGKGNSGVGSSSRSSAESSPLAAAMTSSKIASADIQNLILESARAERFEKEERELEAEARGRGDVRAAAHLRGALAPGDANYNPHHHVDDALEAETGETVGEEGEFDGAMYAGDRGDEEAHEQKKDGMHNLFMDALKNEVDSVRHGLKREKEIVAEGVHEAKAAAAKLLRRGHGSAAGGGDSEGGGGSSSTLPRYPYMSAPVPADRDFSTYEPLGGGRFAEYKDGDAPYDVTPTLVEQSDELARSRRHHVKEAMRHVWRNYQKFAFGKDEMHPISKKATSNWGGMGTTLVDSLDTLWLMGMKDEFWEGRDWVRDHLTHDHVGQVSGFETTIRSLGGLLAAYDLSRDEVFLKKADDLGSRLIKAYDTPSGLPHGSISLESGHSANFGWNSNAYILAEVGTQQVEYRYLSRATGKEDYKRKSEKVFDILHKLQPADGLLMQNMKDNGAGAASFADTKVSFGAMGDSAYEYMIKIWVQGGRKENLYREMWDKAMMGVHEQLVQKSSPSGLTFLADRNGSRLDLKMDHLACFMGGALALGAYTDPKGLDSPRAQRDLKTAKALTYTCYQMYARTKTGIAPEFVQFRGGDDMIVPNSAPFYILRPETVEAFYYLSQLTGDPIYREWGWEVFQSIEKYCKTQYGYGSLKNVNTPNSVEDRMESFFLAETLKYLYLLFDPDSEIDLYKHVFNTEAHPLKVFED